MTQSEAIEFLRQTPLLGGHLPRIEEAIQALARAATLNEDREAALQVMTWSARLSHARHEPDAPARLDRAARQLDAHGLPLEALELRLLLVRCLVDAQQIGAARVHLSRVIGEAGQHPELAADWRLAAASVKVDESRNLLEQALDRLPPSRDHDRLEACLSLAEIAEQGADLARARHHLARALQISETHDDAVLTALISCLIGNLCLCMGRPDEALPALERGYALAVEMNDALSILAQGSILSALLLSKGDHHAAQAIGLQMMSASRTRKSWLGEVDSHILITNCALELEGLEAGVQNLCRARRELIENQAPQTALNLLIARMAEIRFTYGAENVDPLLDSA